MAEHEKKTPSGTEDVEEIRRKKKSAEPVPEKLKAQVGEPNPFAAIMESPIGGASLGEHAALLSDERFSHPANAEQMARLVTELQQSYGNAYVQRVMERIQAEKGSGKPLEAGTRSEMESAFKQDFSDVRIHADATADKLTKDLGAKAVTSGKDIFFREGTYQPGSGAGKKLLGHELTHMVQQEGGTPARDTMGQVIDAFEQEAGRAEEAVGEGRPVSVETASAVPALQREAATTAEAKAPEAGAGVDKARLAALKAMFEAAVVGPMRKAYEVMGGDKPDAQAGFNHVQTSYEVLLSMLPPYKGVEPMYSRLVLLANVLNVWGAQLRPHVGAAAIPLSQIREDLNPDKNTTLEAIRSQF